MHRAARLLAALAATLLPGVAHADFLDHTIRGQWYYPDTATPVRSGFSAVVGAGVEFPTGVDGANGDSYDFGATTLLATQETGGFGSLAFNGVGFTDFNGTIDAITSVTIDAAGTDYAGMDASRISFDADNIWINFAGLRQPGHVLLDVTFAEPVATPEPGTLALFAAALAALAATRRRRDRIG